MSRSKSLTSNFAIVAAFMAASPAFAFEDAATGLKVNPPEPFVAEITQRPRQDVTAGVFSTTGSPKGATSGKYVCEIAFKSASQNAGLTKEDVNMLISGAAWQDTAKQIVSNLMTISSAETYDLDGFTGFEIIGTPKAGPDAENTRMFLSISETAKGRTTTSCAVSGADLESALPQLREIRASITLPQ
jgi:hypothetical protein